MNASFGAHLAGLNQPKSHFDDDSDSIASADLFDAPPAALMLPSKPLLSAALKAREEQEKSQSSMNASFGAHLAGLNQPKSHFDDDSDSIASADLFDAPPAALMLPSKPLLSAALKAREEQEKSQSSMNASFGAHLAGLNQPKSHFDDDSDSIASADLFDAPPAALMLPSKPLLSAALKAREEQEKSQSSMNASFGAHLAGLNQPKSHFDDDSDSIASADLFDAPPAALMLPSKPLLSAALKAREEQEKSQSSMNASFGAHLAGLNQPKSHFDDDSDSIASADLFDAPPAALMLPSKPLLSAALKAREEQEKSQSSMNASFGAHLAGLNQPKSHFDDDSDSIASADLFDAPPAALMLPSKPLLSAALKAREEQEKSQSSMNASFGAHLAGLNQPKSHFDDDSDSIASADLFDAPPAALMLPSKPLLSAALKAREEQEKSQSSLNAREEHEKSQSSVHIQPV